jgi:hypothetical protein
MCLAILDDYPVALKAFDYLPDPLVRQTKKFSEPPVTDFGVLLVVFEQRESAAGYLLPLYYLPHLLSANAEQVCQALVAYIWMFVTVSGQGDSISNLRHGLLLSRANFPG